MARSRRYHGHGVPALALKYHRLRGRRVVHLLHIGKTGGSALKAALIDRESPTSVLILHDHPTRLRSVPEGDGVAFFVRDPLERFVSGFYSRQRKGQPRYLIEWSPGEAAAFRQFATPNELGVALSAEDTRIREAAEQAMRSIEHVRDGYWTWFESEAYFRRRLKDVVFVGAQETLDQDYARFCEQLDLAGRRGLPRDDVAAHRNPRELDKTLDPTAVANLRRWYADDYRFLELCQDFREH